MYFNQYLYYLIDSNCLNKQANNSVNGTYHIDDEDDLSACVV